MSEKRRPESVVTIQTSVAKRRYEIFSAEQFADRMAQVPFQHAEQPNLTLTQIDLETQKFVRVRCDGVWLPLGQRALFPLSRATFLIAQELSASMRKVE